jgi:hypothetical protein
MEDRPPHSLQGVGKFGRSRLPWKQEPAGSNPATLTNSP